MKIPNANNLNIFCSRPREKETRNKEIKKIKKPTALCFRKFNLKLTKKSIVEAESRGKGTKVTALPLDMLKP